MAGRVGLEFALRGPFGSGAKRRSPEEPFRLLLVGDFAGRGAGQPRSALKPPIQVDAADFERAFAKCEATLSVAVGGAEAEALRLEGLDDFHPEQLFEKLALFAAARDVRRALVGGSAQGLARARAWLGRERAASPGSPVEASDDAATLTRLLGDARTAAPAPSTAASAETAAQALIQRAVAGHIAPDVAGERGPLLAEFDRALSTTLRAILRAESFRSLEARWRGAERVARSLDSDEELTVALFDATKEELAAAFAAAGAELESSAVHAALVRGDQRWTLVCCDFSFDGSERDLTLLAQLGATAARAGGTLIADAAPGFFGASSGDATEPKSWSEAPLSALGQALRASPLAGQIGLAFPRVLARRPYGKKRDPVSAFAFEEIEASTGFSAAERVYGPAAFAVAELLGRRFRESGWDDDEGLLELEELPLDTFDDDGERRLAPATEVLLREATIAEFLERGVMPLMARRDRPSVRLPRLVCLADPLAPIVLGSGESQP